MDLILISSTKLKIMLTSEDMAAYSLTCDNIDYDNTETRRAFWDILDTAKHKTGFDAASDRVFIQVYPSKSGGCEMYVTKLVRHEDAVRRDDIRLFDKKKQDSPPVLLSVERASPECYYEVYSFDSFYSMLDACRQLMLVGYEGKSEIWTEDAVSRYYLAYEDDGDDQYNFLGEYGSRHSSPAAYTYIAEHCRCLCKNGAVEIMAALV